MCGLFGYIGTNVNKSALSILGKANEIRGTDSWGVAVITKDERQIYKEIGAFSLMDNFPKYPLRKELCTIIGHTRAKTAGAVNVENAHPFDLGEGWVGAKNGTVSNWKELCNHTKVPTTGIEVDSDGFMQSVLVDFPNEHVLENYVGGACVTMANSPGEVYLFKGASKSSYGQNKGNLVAERPLFILKTKFGIYWSSLESSLQFIQKIYKYPGEIKSFYVNSFMRLDYLGNYELLRRVDRKELNAGNVTVGGNMNSYKSYYNSSNSNFTTNTHRRENERKVKDKSIKIEEYAGQIYWHDGVFKLNGFAADGKFYVNDNGYFKTMPSDDSSYKPCYFVKGILVSEQGFQTVRNHFIGSNHQSYYSFDFIDAGIKKLSESALFPYSVGILFKEKHREDEWRSSDKDGYPNEVEYTPFARCVELTFGPKGKLICIDDFSSIDEKFFQTCTLNDIKILHDDVFENLDEDQVLKYAQENTNSDVYPFLFKLYYPALIDGVNFGSVQTDDYEDDSEDDSEEENLRDMSDSLLEKEIQKLVDNVISPFYLTNLKGDVYQQTPYYQNVEDAFFNLIVELENARETSEH